MCLRGGFTVAIVFLTLSFAALPSQAQEREPQHVHPAGDDGAGAHEHAHGLDLFSGRDASGTAWEPLDTSMFGTHLRAGAWQLMVHGQAFLQYLHEYAPVHRGSEQLGSINWLMVMARRPLGRGRVGLRVMSSLEPWTIRGCGYPDLLASGELCDGDGLHDRQHPHDLVMELAGEYEQPVGHGLTWHVYGGPSGEPALGPPAFPHRLSAMPNPIAPISHHWLDSTHISYGVATTGLSSARWRAEASAFNGREPDERRTDLDLGRLDSFSARVTFTPAPSLVLQVSSGRLESAEQDFAGGPRYDIARTTASALHVRRVGTRGRLGTTLAWGTNAERGQRTHAVLAESALSLAERDVFFGRIEINSKPSHALHIHEQPGAILTVAKAQAGYTRFLRPRPSWQLGFGGTLSAGIVPAAIRPNYGGVGLGVGVSATVRPAAH